MKFQKLLAFFLGTILTSTSAQSQNFPNRPVRIIIPYAAGGGATILTRGLQQGLSEALKVPVVMENKAGGATLVGTSEVARAAPDGYTLLMIPPLAWVGYYYSKTYETKVWEEMTPIAQFAETPYNMIITRSGSGLDTWAKVVERAKAKPGTISGGGPAAGGLVGYTFNQLMEKSSVSGVYVPFQGSSPAFAALLGGHVDFQITTLGDGMTSTRAGQTHALAVSSDGRAASARDVPTFAELGIGDTLMNTFSFWGPKGIDPKVVETLARAVQEAIKDPKYAEMAEKRDYKVGFKPGAQVHREVKLFDEKWGPKLAADAK